MFKWLKITIQINLREYHKVTIEKKFNLFSIFKGDSRVVEFVRLGRHLKEAELIPYEFFNMKKMIKRLDRIKLDVGWHIGFDIIYKSKKVKLPILYCYKEKFSEDFTYLEKLYDNAIWDYGELPFIKSTPVSIYHHITVEPTEMGAWQVFLLQRLPFWYYEFKFNKRKHHDYLIFSYEDLYPIMMKYHIIIPNNMDLRPYVWMKGNEAHVTCCRWMYRAGLIRELITIVFKEDRVIDILENYYDYLFEYNPDKNEMYPNSS